MKKYFFLFLLITGCENISKVVAIDKLSVYRTSRDSTYFFKRSEEHTSELQSQD